MDNVNIVSLGVGVQSSAMLLMAMTGHIKPKPEVAIFADPGWESESTYNYLSYLKKISTIPIIVTNNGNIRKSLINSNNRFASLPFFTENGGLGRRQCTNEYKIVPTIRAIRKYLNYDKNQRVKHKVNLWLGISTDESIRMKPSRTSWITNTYPLIDKRLNRSQCISWLKTNNFNIPTKSSCIGCPFHSDTTWLDMKNNQPSEFVDAVLVDKALRIDSKFKQKQYLHRSCIPLNDVDFNENQTDLFGNECEGHCGL